MEQHIPGIVLKDGLTQPVFDYKRCLFEKVYVETPVDTDGDGRLDLIAVYRLSANPGNAYSDTRTTDFSLQPGFRTF